MARSSGSAERPTCTSPETIAETPEHLFLHADSACLDASASIIDAVTKVFQARNVLLAERRKAQMSSKHWWTMAAADHVRFEQTVQLLIQAHRCLTHRQNIRSGITDERLDENFALQPVPGSAGRPADNCETSSAERPTASFSNVHDRLRSLPNDSSLAETTELLKTTEQEFVMVGSDHRNQGINKTEQTECGEIRPANEPDAYCCMYATKANGQS